MTVLDVLLLILLLIVIIVPTASAVFRVHRPGDLPQVPFGFDGTSGGVGGDPVRDIAADLHAHDAGTGSRPAEREVMRRHQHLRGWG